MAYQRKRIVTKAGVAKAAGVINISIVNGVAAAASSAAAAIMAYQHRKISER